MMNEAIEQMLSELRKTNDTLDTVLDQILLRTGISQRVETKSNVSGFIVGAVAGLSIACCIGSFFFTMYVARTLTNELRDLHAWQDVLKNKVIALESKPKEQGK